MARHLVFRIEPRVVTHAERIEAVDSDEARRLFCERFGGSNPLLLVVLEEEHARIFESHGETPECVGCGRCCSRLLCHVGRVTYGEIFPCPGLVWEGGRYWCEIQRSSSGEALANLRLLLHCGGARGEPREGGCGF